MNAVQMLEKLESHEQQAYKGGYGADWLADVGENLKFYVERCVENNEEPTMSGLMDWIDGIAE